MKEKYLMVGMWRWNSNGIFAEDQILLAKSEDDLHQPVHKLQPILTKYNMNISETKTKVMAVNGKRFPRVKIVINNKIIE